MWSGPLAMGSGRLVTRFDDSPPTRKIADALVLRNPQAPVQHHLLLCRQFAVRILHYKAQSGDKISGTTHGRSPPRHIFAPLCQGFCVSA